MGELLRGWPDAFAPMRGRRAAISDSPPRMLSFEQIELLAPVPRPGKIVAAGVNYQAHASEGGKGRPRAASAFRQVPTAVVGTRRGDPLVAQPDAGRRLRGGAGSRDRPRRRVASRSGKRSSYVAGYTCLNDVSARDLQFADRQFVRGKSLDTFCPMGPWLVTADEVGDPQNLAIRCSVNGETLQEASTSEMVFGVAELVSFCSQAFTLEPGDVIATGTPSGVGWYREPRVLLKDGDEVVVEIERVGRLVNTAARRRRPTAR